MKRHKRLIFIGGAIAVLIITGVVLFVNRTLTQSPEQSQYESAVLNLNQTFQNILATIEVGDTEGMRNALQREVEKATNPLERGALLLTLAQYTIVEDVREGVALHKTMVKDDSLPSNVRAAALVDLAFLYYTGTIEQAALTEEVFGSEEPYIYMRPRENTERERERSYTALLLEAEKLYPTPLANSYIARYWAKEAFDNMRTGSDFEENAANARTHVERYRILVSELNTTPQDPNIPMSAIQNGIATLYLSALTDEESGSSSLVEIGTGLSGLDQYSQNLLAQYKEHGTQEQVYEADVHRILHNVWKELLSAAVAVQANEPDAARRIAELYAAYIQSPEGLQERILAVSGNSDISEYISSLKSLSDVLKNAL